LASGLFIAGFFLFRHNRKNIFPLALTFLFICPFVLLAFSTLWPFRISSRYMMVPFLGVLWLGVRAVSRLKIKMQNILIISLIVLFGSGIIAGMQRYRTERDFWQNALDTHPRNSFVLQKMAGICYEDKDDFTSRYYYHRALQSPMGKNTAVEISIGLAKLAFQRCDYAGALKWLNRLTFSLSPYQEYHIIKLKALILMSAGDESQAEMVLKEILRRFPDRVDAVALLMDLYVGRGRWDRARQLEELMEKKFSPLKRIDAGQMEMRFRQADPRQKINFYIRYRNYPAAIDQLRKIKDSGIQNLLLLGELYYKVGDSRSGEELVNRLLARDPGDFQLRNNLGFFYLKRLSRLDEALRCLEDSLGLNPDQPGIAKLVEILRDQKARIDPYLK
jgi:tetratricopeptide (TPR) repeat protein